MNENRIKRNKMLGEKIIAGLNSRNMAGYYAESKEEALAKALELIPEGSSIAWGGTMSVGEIGLKEAVCQGNYQVYNRDAAATPEEKRKIELITYDCDFFLTSANAITEDGVIVNIDNTGNRVAAISFGPDKVFLVIGANKVTEDYDSALFRARNVAAPKNAKRLNRKTPCALTGDKCYDCKSPERICRNLSVLWNRPTGIEYHVVLINEELGY